LSWSGRSLTSIGGSVRVRAPSLRLAAFGWVATAPGGPAGAGGSILLEATDGGIEVAEAARIVPKGSACIDGTPVTLAASGDISVAPGLYDGRTVSGCMGGTITTSINYIGLQYYRGGINHNSFYSHTLPINWNRNTGNAATQKYDCGDASFRRAHIAASSYHSGVVNVCMGDGSVRSVRDSIDFAVWQAVGTRSNGESMFLD